MEKISLLFSRKNCMNVCMTGCTWGGQKRIAAVFEHKI